MARISNFKNKRLVQALLVLLLMVGMPVFGQNPNLITNGSFEQTSFNYQTISDYQRITGGTVGEGQFIHEQTSTGHGAGTGWPNNLTAYDGSWYLLFNGFGGNINPTKAAFKTVTPITVTPNTIYTFTVHVRNLSQGYMGYNPNPANLGLKINNQQVSTKQLETNNNWVLWSYTWNSGSATQANIKIVDTYTGQSGLGDDFGMDDIVFKLHDDYSLSAEHFDVLFCVDDITPIDLTGHYTMTYPSGGNSAPPMQVEIKYHSGDPWAPVGTTITTGHGTAYVGTDNKVYYTPDAGYHGTDYIRYRISRFGLVTSSRNIYITVMDAPSNCNPQGLPGNGHICLSDISSFNPSANWSSNGGTITYPNGQWQWKKDGVTGWQNSNIFLGYVQNQGGVGEYSIKFLATNDCGSVESDSYSFTVCDVPQWITQPNVTSVCTGSAEPTVSVNMNFNSGVQTWQYKRGGGNWTNFVWGEFSLQPGDQIRYLVTWDYCGGGPLTSAVINVVSGPEFINTIPVTFSEGYCPGSQVSLPQIQSSWYNAFGMSVTAHWYYVIDNPSGSPDYQQINGNTITLNNGSVSVTPCLQNTECGFTPYYPAFDLVVWDAPSIQGLENLPDTLGPYCDGQTTLSSVLPNLTPGGHYSGYGWEISSGQSQSGFSSNLPTVLSIGDNGRWLRYHVTKDCASHNDAYSTPIQLWVIDEPTVGSISNIVPPAVCEPYTPSFPAPNIQAHGSDLIYPETGWQMQLNGQWVPLPNLIEYQHNGNSIRYHALNGCGDANSNVVQLTVNAIPIVNNIEAPNGVCEGTALALPNPTSFVTWRHNDPNTCIGIWEVQIDGEWVELTNSNIPFEYNGYLIRYKARNGCCDEGEFVYSNEVVITVYSTQPIVLPDVTFCQPGSYHGVWCEQDGHVYGYDSITPNNCTIHISWLFHLNEGFNIVPETVDRCDAYYWSQNGMTYYETGVYYDTVVHPNPEDCDDLYVLTLTINHAPEITSNLQSPSDICVGDLLNVNTPSYQMNHTGDGTLRWDFATEQNGPFYTFDPTTAHLDYGSYYLRFVVINDCDSTFSNVVSFHVNDRPVIDGELAPLQVCEGNTLDLPDVSVVWMNFDPNDRFSEWQMSETQNGNYISFNPNVQMQMSQNGYWVRYFAQNSCDEVVLGPVSITVLSAEDVWLETITACDSYQLPSGEIITESQTIDYVEEEPCPHTIHQPIEIHHSDYVVEPITSCHEEFVWHGMTFYYSDQTQYVWDTLQNQNLCDSIVELNLSFDEYSSYTHNRTACESYEWEMNPGHVYYESVRDSVFVPAVDPEDCDTWYYLELVIGHATEVEGDPMTECSGFEWHGVSYYADAIVYDSLKTAITHCDSIVSHHLTIIQPFQTEMEMTQCQPFWWYENYCDHNGDFEHTFESVEGCDSIVTMHFTLTETLVHEFDTLACEGFEWYGNSCTESGHTYSHVFQTPQGCDSLVKMHVTLNVMQMFTQFVSACDSIKIGGVMYNQPGSYYIYGDTLFNQNGCDSIIYRINLNIRNSESMGVIEGSHEVYVASNLINGIYRYDIDTTGLISQVTWTIDNPDWQVVEHQPTYCRVLVSTPGSGVLRANFQTASCGQMEKQFEIHAGFFGVDEHGIEVKVYPNPTKGNVTIEAEGIESIRLTNMMGQTLDWRECDRSDNLTLDLRSYVPSVYLLEIKTINGLVKKRVVVCR